MDQYFGKMLQAVSAKRKAAEARNRIQPIGGVSYTELESYSKQEVKNGTPLSFIVDNINYQIKKHNEVKGGK